MQILPHLKTISLSILILILLDSCSAGSDTQPQPNNNLATLTRLSTNGTNFVDPNNQFIYLRGVNMMSKTPTDLLTLGFNQANVNLMKTSNFTVVRLGVMWAYVEPTPNQYNEQYLNQIASIIKMLAAQGIYTIIDFHEDEYSSIFGDGAPGWAAILPNEATSSPDYGFPANLFCDGEANSESGLNCRTDINYAYASFWSNASYQGVGLQQYYINMVQHVVTQFQYLQGDIVGYDLVNEPYLGINFKNCVTQVYPLQTKACPEFDQTLGTFYDTLITAIRQIDQNTIIFYEPNLLFGLGQYSDPIISVPDKKLVFSFHNYDTNDLATVYQNAIVIGKKRNVQIMLTEFGGDISESTIESSIEIINKDSLSYTYWTYFNNPTYKFTSGSGLPANPALQGIVYDLANPLNPTNVNYNVLSDLNTLYIFKSNNINFSSVIKNNDGSYDLYYNTISTVKSSIILNVATGCTYNIFDDHGNLLTSEINQNTETITLDNIAATHLKALPTTDCPLTMQP